MYLYIPHKLCYTPSMEYTKIVSYIKQFNAQGMPLDSCYSMLYLTPEEIDLVESDEELMAEVRDNEKNIVINRLVDYNRKVELSQSPSDALKRLQVFHPNVFKEPGTSNNGLSGELIIKKVRMSEE